MMTSRSIIEERFENKELNTTAAQSAFIAAIIEVADPEWASLAPGIVDQIDSCSTDALIDIIETSGSARWAMNFAISGIELSFGQFDRIVKIIEQKQARMYACHVARLRSDIHPSHKKRLLDIVIEAGNSTVAYVYGHHVPRLEAHEQDKLFHIAYSRRHYRSIFCFARFIPGILERHRDAVNQVLSDQSGRSWLAMLYV
jgi:hypothetical protein